MSSRTKNGKDKGLSKRQKKEVLQLHDSKVESKDHVYVQSPSQQVSVYGWVTAGEAGIDLSAVPMGDNAYERIGIKVQPFFLQLRMQLGYSDSTNLIRLVLVQYYTVSNDTPTLSETFQTIGINCVISPYNRQLGSTMRVLRDQVYTLNNDGAERQRYVNWKMKLKAKDITFADNQVYGHNHIFLIAVSDSLSPNHPSVTFVSRLSYKDA